MTEETLLDKWAGASESVEDILPTGHAKKIYDKDATVFTAGELAATLNRSAVTIRKWEREGIIPTSGHDTEGANGDPRGRRRYYTLAQVRAIIEIAKEEGVFIPGPRVRINDTFFTQKVKSKFRKLEKERRVA